MMTFGAGETGPGPSKVPCITRVILCCRPQMEVNEFKDMAKEMVDYIGGYLENIRDR